MGADGTAEGSVDPVHFTIICAILFILVLLLGGLWFRASMTRKEIAVSSAITAAVYLIVVLVQLLVPNLPAAFVIAAAYFQNWPATVTSLLSRMTGHAPVSALLSCFAPLLFIPFGKSPE